MKTEISYGARRFPYQLRFSERKRLRIVVRPDLSVAAEAPRQFSEAEAIEAIHSKARWIVRQLDSFARFHPLPTPNRYISGETFLYLGRQYRLKVSSGDDASAKLRGRFLHVVVRDSKKTDTIRQLVQGWYRSRASEIFGRYLDICSNVAQRHGMNRPPLTIREMRTRWGSCAASGRMTLNLHLIQTPVHCIEYVIMHELCHLEHHDHSPRFYRLLTRCMPDWKKRKAVLDRIAIADSGLRGG